MTKEVNVTRTLFIASDDVKNLPQTERDIYVLKRFKEAGFDTTKHIGRFNKAGGRLYVQNFVRRKSDD